MSQTLGYALEEIGRRRESEPDFGAREFALGDEEIELHGDDLARLEMFDEL